MGTQNENFDLGADNTPAQASSTIRPSTTASSLPPRMLQTGHRTTIVDSSSGTSVDPISMMSSIPSFVLVPMPLSGSPDAPSFDGTEVSNFVDYLEQLARNAGIVNLDELIPYVLRYSSLEVGDAVRYEDAFVKGNDEYGWDNAKQTLLSIYAEYDTKPKITHQDLLDFCRHQNENGAIESSKDIDRYRIAYQKFANGLVVDGVISKNQRNYYFIAGLPSKVKDWFIQALPKTQRSPETAPSVLDSVKLLKTRFRSNNLYSTPWALSSQAYKNQVRLDLNSNRVDPTVTTLSTSTPSTNTSAKQFKEMTLNLSSLVDKINGQTIQHCPETAALICDHLIIQDAATNRYLLPNGESLLRNPFGFNGGVAQYLRSITNVTQTSQTTMGNNNARDIPPHMDGVRTSHSMGLVYEQEDVLRSLGPTAYRSFQVSHQEDHHNSYPTLRSQKTNNRFDFTKRPDDIQPTSTQRPQETITKRPNQQPQNAPAPNPQPQPTQLANRQPPQSPPKRDINIPPPTNPVNCQEGQRDLKNKDRDICMREAPSSTLPKGPTYHFTSTLSEQAELQKVYEYIMKHKISLPIGQILGSSPQLQKIFTENTHTKREYTTKEAEYSVNDSSSSFPSAPSSLHVGNPEELGDFLFRYANAVVIDKEKFYGMSTGKMEVTVGGRTFTAMIDSGSELNLMS
ncbi:hypothetical protein D9758_010654 [Tetrapyrgos nigripes]|uniref:DUF4100 domain-containing protein n=1 Tax=Tetrapyrgos nigripes TaxID=182062 RepID=A0A8H5GGE6_9AGAR|nr:hypothetical protein D9758_010654 [Tetrapyrgos nigripes]